MFKSLKQRGAALRVALPTNYEFLSTLHGRQQAGVPATAGASFSSSSRGDLAVSARSYTGTSAGD
jgi:hypothetical protein